MRNSFSAFGFSTNHLAGNIGMMSNNRNTQTTLRRTASRNDNRAMAMMRRQRKRMRSRRNGSANARMARPPARVESQSRRISDLPQSRTTWNGTPSCVRTVRSIGPFSSTKGMTPEV